MAGALAPLVWLMVVASLLFGLAGWLDGIHPGGSSWSLASYGGLGWTSYAFGLLNVLVAVLIARGSERFLILRIGLAAAFVVERTTTAFYPEPRSSASISVHLATALVEAVILTATWRLWRSARMVTLADLSALALPRVAPARSTGGGGPAPATAANAARPPVTAAPARGRGPMAHRVAPRIPRGASRSIAVLAFILAVTFVADAVLAGAIPGATVDPSSPDRLVYLYALVVLAAAAAAVGGRRLPLRLLLVVSVILFVERAFTLFLLVGQEPGTASLALHLLAAGTALILALVCAAALRATRPRRPPQAAPA